MTDGARALAERLPEVTCQCGHSDRMHREGVSPRYAGCMVTVEPPTEHRRRSVCSCDIPPSALHAVGLEKWSSAFTRWAALGVEK